MRFKRTELVTFKKGSQHIAMVMSDSKFPRGSTMICVFELTKTTVMVVNARRMRNLTKEEELKFRLGNIRMENGDWYKYEGSTFMKEAIPRGLFDGIKL